MHKYIIFNIVAGMLWEGREVHDPRTDDPLLVREFASLEQQKDIRLLVKVFLLLLQMTHDFYN